MEKTIYIVTKHSYWEHFGAAPCKVEFNTKEEADKAASDYEREFFMEDGYHATVHPEKRIVITPEEQKLHVARVLARKQHAFDYKKDSYAWGLYTFWDGTKAIAYIRKYVNGDYNHNTITFVRDKVTYDLLTHLDYFKGHVKSGWIAEEGESFKIYGGTCMVLPKDCRNVDMLQLKRNKQSEVTKDVQGLINAIIPDIAILL